MIPANQWHELIRKFHAEDYPDAPESLVIGEPASEDEIATLEMAVGVRMPDEFKDFYRACNGFGRMENGQVIWLFSPLEGIPAVTEMARDAFKRTHPELAEAYVAFVDWDCGDFSGYLFDPEGGLIEGIFDFEYAEYEFDREQDFAEFLAPLFLSIEDFFTIGEA